MKYSKKEITKALKSVMESKGCAGFVMQGYYSLSHDNFITAVLEFLETGDDTVLSEHERITHLGWTAESEYDICPEDRELFRKALLHETYWDIYTFYNDEELTLISRKVEYCEAQEEYRRSKDYIRRVATAFTTNKKTRKAVFEKKGRVCVYCGSHKHIHLDHIMPVSKGGENTIENLQPLCRSCNSKKGNKNE